MELTDSENLSPPADQLLNEAWEKLRLYMTPFPQRLEPVSTTSFFSIFEDSSLMDINEASWAEIKWVEKMNGRAKQITFSLCITIDWKNKIRQYKIKRALFGPFYWENRTLLYFFKFSIGHVLCSSFWLSICWFSSGLCTLCWIVHVLTGRHPRIIEFFGCRFDGSKVLRLMGFF